MFRAFASFKRWVQKQTKSSLDAEIDLAVCVKTVDRKVIFQNKLCLDVCSNQMGKVCTKGCMKDYTSPKSSGGQSSTQYLALQSVEGRSCEGVILDDGESITTLFQPLEPVEKVFQILENLRLSKREKEIFLKIIEGKSNSEIAKELFVSHATIKTHINNINKKLPSEMKQSIRD